MTVATSGGPKFPWVIVSNYTGMLVIRPYFWLFIRPFFFSKGPKWLVIRPHIFFEVIKPNGDFVQGLITSPPVVIVTFQFDVFTYIYTSTPMLGPKSATCNKFI